MRFDTPIYFQTIKAGSYQPDGNYEAESISEEMRYASVTSTGANTQNLVYGELKQSCLTVRLQNRYTKPFDRIRIGKKVYRVDMTRPLRTKQTFVVSEVQENAQNQS